MAGDQQAPSGVDPTKPNIARIYDYFLGGKDNFAADRAAGHQILRVSPEVRSALRANRSFLGRVVRFLAGEAGITQFIDLGTGLPTQENVHQVAQATNPPRWCTSTTTEDNPSVIGFVDNPYRVDHFVLCHQAPSEVAEGNTAFTFVSDGIENAVARAKASAGSRNVVIGGGATIARLCLDAGLVDEIRIALRPLVINGGLRLFDQLEAKLSLEPAEVKATPDVTHLRYRVVE